MCVSATGSALLYRVEGDGTTTRDGTPVAVWAQDITTHVFGEILAPYKLVVDVSEHTGGGRVHVMGTFVTIR